MQAFSDGIGWGLVLCFLIGPIFFALIQAGIEQGFRAGIVVALGIWVSDFIFIAAVYWGIAYLIRLTEWQGFEQYLGVGGGLILMTFGVATIGSKMPPMLPEKKQAKHFSGSYFHLWIKGFLINTINPFTFFFWIGIMTTVVVKTGLSSRHAFLFFAGIMSTIILTDSMKVGLAKVISRWMTVHHVLWMRRISGAALFIFGIALIIRVLW